MNWILVDFQESSLRTGSDGVIHQDIPISFSDGKIGIFDLISVKTDEK